MELSWVSRPHHRSLFRRWGDRNGRRRRLARRVRRTLVRGSTRCLLRRLPPPRARCQNGARLTVISLLAGFADSAGRKVMAAAVAQSDSLFGHSGKLRAHFLSTTRHSLALPILEHFFRDSAVKNQRLRGERQRPRCAFVCPITMLPFGTKSKGRVGDYRVGWWPAERRRARSPAYVNPDGFIRVTRTTRHPGLRAFSAPGLPDPRSRGRVAQVPGAA